MIFHCIRIACGGRRESHIAEAMVLTQTEISTIILQVCGTESKTFIFALRKQ